MQIEPGELMQQIYDENTRWVVRCDRQEYEVSGKQLNIIREASKQNIRGMVWFKKFAISIPHISSIHLVGRDLPRDRQLPSRTRVTGTTIAPEKLGKIVGEIKEKHKFLNEPRR